MGRVPRNVGETVSRTATPPCVKLKTLRNRANITALSCAKACNLSSPNSFYRYESVERMGDTPIPDHIIVAIMPLIVGRGMPPVTADELLAISSAHKLLSVKAKTAGSGPAPTRLLPQPPVAPHYADAAVDVPLTVRYRAEPGVYMDPKAVHQRTFGMAPIVAARDIRAEQFSVLVADTGEVLHCVVPSAFTAAQLIGKRVVVTQDKSGVGLVEVAVARVTGARGNTQVLEDVRGKAVDGEVYGVVVGAYTREA